jgi:hypothetical protein
MLFVVQIFDQHHFVAFFVVDQVIYQALRQQYTVPSGAHALRLAVLEVLQRVIPNLLGFLLYFALRRPLGSSCPTCGQLIAAEQRFCSWCGSQSFAPPPAPGGFHSPGSGTGPTNAI